MNRNPALLLAALLLWGSSLQAQQPKLPPPPQNTTPSTWCRFIPERVDDFAWENDLIAFRAYGPAIKKAKGAENSGVDVWLKRVNYPIVDRWYALNQKGFPYHTDFGEGCDPYHTGASRGCGGTGIWKNGDLVLPGPYKEWKIISREAQKSVFELTYDYTLEGGTIREVKQITIELGKRLFCSQSTFTKEGKPVAGLDVGIGITTHGLKAKAAFAPSKGWMYCWETIGKHGLGTGVAISPAAVVEMKQHLSPTTKENHALLLTRTDSNGRTTHYAGYGWEAAGVITTPEQWATYLDQFTANLKN